MFNKDVSNISKDIFEYFFDTNSFSLKQKSHIKTEERLGIEINNLKKQIQDNQEKLEKIVIEKEQAIQENDKLKNEIDMIYNSRSWKLFRIFQRIKKGES